MKIGLMSDSHGNIEYLRIVLDRLRKEKIDFIIHLGDNYSDLEEFNLSNIIKVPGVYDEEYENRSIKHRIVRDFEKLKFLISHTPTSHPNDFENDIKPENFIKDRKIDVFLFGHTHLYELKNENGIVFVNPGHLKKRIKKEILQLFLFSK